MRYLTFSVPKAGVEDARNEDACSVRELDDDDLLVVMADGASTGVFSRDWARHLAGGIDSSWMQSEERFDRGLVSLRESFRPDLSRPTAQRKFIMEGSYATVMALLIHRPFWWLARLRCRLFAVGDVTVFAFDRFGRMEFSFPQRTVSDFGNTPELFRSSERLQAKTPFTLLSQEFSVPRNGLLVVASDAIAEYLFGLPEIQRYDVLKKIAACAGPAGFGDLVTGLRAQGMKNDDVTVCLATPRPELHFPDRGES